MNQPFTTKRRIEFGDTDMAGIVHFANFFRYMESAETDLLLSKGLSVAWNEQGKKYGFPRVSVNCDFKRPAKFGETLQIAVTIEEIGRKSVRYRFDFSRDGAEIATGHITTVFCRSTPENAIESLEIPEEIREKLSGQSRS